MITIIIVLIVGVFFLWLILAYNSFVRNHVRIGEAWSDIDVQLKRRYDLIPNLLNTVKGYADHERDVFENVTKARQMAMGARSIEEHAKAETALTASLKSLFAVSEAYPELKANENFLQFANEVADTENKIQAARRFYNTVVRDMNILLDSFPSNVVGSWFRFKKESFFDLEESKEREPVKVKFT